MYTHIWNKYLPLIHLLMKRAVASDQLLDMNVTDFERTGTARKAGHRFTILFRGGRLETMVSSLPLARDLAAALLSDPRVKELMEPNDYAFQLSSKYQLGIRLIARAPGVPAAE